MVSTVSPDKSKDSEHPGFPAPKHLPLQPGLHSSRGSIPHPVPSLVPSHLGKHHAAAGGIHGALAAAMMTHRASEAAWLTRQRGQGQEREGPLEMGLRSPGKGAELRRDSHRWKWLILLRCHSVWWDFETTFFFSTLFIGVFTVKHKIIYKEEIFYRYRNVDTLKY